MAIRILLLQETDPSETIKNMLSEKTESDDSFEITAVETMSTAVARLVERKYDGILLDCELSGNSGVETFILLNHRYGNTPVIVFNGEKGDESAIKNSYKAGAQDYYFKGELNGALLRRSIRHAMLRTRHQAKGVGQKDLLINTETGIKANKDIRILLVEDDEDQAKLLEVLLGKLAYILKIVSSAEDALETIVEFQPDIVLSDLYLPKMNGVEMSGKIHHIKGMEDMPVIMISSDINEDTVINALANGIYDFVGKPLRMAELTLRIGNLLHLQDNKKKLANLAVKLEKEKNILSRYFSDDFVEKLLSEEIQTSLGGKEVYSTIMFFDLRNSTGIAETLDPDTFTKFLSQLWNDIMDIVLSNGGSVNKLMGDGMLATFGCPEPGKHDALSSVTAAIKIRQYFQLYNEISPHDLKDVRFGIGIASGKIFAGNIGSFRRMEYTVLGDAVNVASRLEGLTKRAGVDILIEGTTRNELGDKVRVRRVKVKHVKGRKREMEIFSVVDLRKD